MRSPRGLAAALLAIIGAAVVGAHQAPPPSPDVFIAAVTPLGDGIDMPINVSHNPGFDSQPAFTVDSRNILFSSNRDGKQTEIYRCGVKSKSPSRVTRTDDNEYTPRPLPDGKGFSAVRVEAGGVQRLWVYPDRGKPAPVVEAAKRVSTYAWIDSTHVALGLLDVRLGTIALELADLSTGVRTPIAPSVGRCLVKRADGNTLNFAVRSGEPGAPITIKSLDLKTRRVTDLLAGVKGGEDFAWMPSGDLLMAAGNTIYHWTKKHPTWSRMAELPATLCSNVTRLTVSPDGKWLAFVAEPYVKPARGRSD